MEDFKTVKENAWSLPPGTDPTGMELLYVEEGKHATFKYYLDKNTGEYRYTSSVTDGFQKWMEEKTKERRMKDVQKNQRVVRRASGTEGARIGESYESAGQVPESGCDIQTAVG